MLSLQDPMVIFTTSNWKERISEYRGDRFTKIITMDLGDMFVAKLFNKSFWQHQLELDPEKKVHKSYYLHQVQKPRRLTFSHGNQVQLTDYQFVFTDFQFVSPVIKFNT